MVKEKNNVAIIIAIIVIVLLVAIIVYFYYGNDVGLGPATSSGAEPTALTSDCGNAPGTPFGKKCSCSGIACATDVKEGTITCTQPDGSTIICFWQYESGGYSACSCIKGSGPSAPR